MNQLLPFNLKCLCRRAHSSALLWLCHDITPYLEYVKFIALTKHLQEIVYVGQSTDCPIKGFQRFSGVVLFSIYFLSTFLLFSNSFFFYIIILCLWKPSLSSLHYWQFNKNSINTHWYINKDLNQHIEILTTTKNNRHIDILTKNPINTFALKTSYIANKHLPLLVPPPAASHSRRQLHQLLDSWTEHGLELRMPQVQRNYKVFRRFSATWSEKSSRPATSSPHSQTSSSPAIAISSSSTGSKINIKKVNNNMRIKDTHFWFYNCFLSNIKTLLYL